MFSDKTNQEIDLMEELIENLRNVGSEDSRPIHVHIPPSLHCIIDSYIGYMADDVAVNCDGDPQRTIEVLLMRTMLALEDMFRIGGQMAERGIVYDNLEPCGCLERKVQEMINFGRDQG